MTARDDQHELAAPEPSLRAVAVVPARDEAQRIGACIRGLAGQMEVAACEYEVIVVLDECRDATASRLRQASALQPRLRLHVVELAVSQGVGVARRTGMDLACGRLLSVSRPEGLITSTDADSVVAPDWVARQLELVGRGARAIGGDIELDPAELALLPAAAVAERERRARARMGAVSRSEGVASAEHCRFSGASLGLTARSYGECGGLPVREALEDEALEAALRRFGIPIHRSLAVRVRTSARTDGRAPMGLARDLARWSSGSFDEPDAAGRPTTAAC